MPIITILQLSYPNKEKKAEFGMQYWDEDLNCLYGEHYGKMDAQIQILKREDRINEETLRNISALETLERTLISHITHHTSETITLHESAGTRALNQTLAPLSELMALIKTQLMQYKHPAAATEKTEHHEFIYFPEKHDYKTLHQQLKTCQEHILTLCACRDADVFLSQKKIALDHLRKIKFTHPSKKMVETLKSTMQAIKGLRFHPDMYLSINFTQPE